MAAEPLAEDQKTQTRTEVIRGLVGTLVDEEAVEAAHQGYVGHLLQVAGVPGVGTTQHTVGGEALACHDILSVDMGS